ncbi:Uncharacterized protein dnl_04550 [Desulfonema limicola]|uniref:Uncharacterized protein n=1 Tax=Desulfonema limicola TaxID=45656 RepID=A0A975B3Q1_9BACT|nr:hypothetical protein [Desulfonema limicola]QTA78235.1 Uncharacterized protein dnl_04550 [Desulfonema limicola]
MPKKIKWLDIAVDDFEQDVEYVAQYNMEAAKNLAKRIYNLRILRGARKWPVSFKYKI